MNLGLDFFDLDAYLLNQKGKIIHQVWFGTIPNKSEAKKAYKKLKLYRDSWLIKNPNWCRVEWNKEMTISLLKNFYPEHIDMFNKYIYEIQRCDVVRYLILHRYGGWYADMDYYCNRPLDDAICQYKNNIYFVQSPNTVLGQDSDHISNSLMYSVPNHAFWKQLMIELQKNQELPFYYTKHLRVMFSTGPAILNRVYHKYKNIYSVKSLPWKLFHPYGIKDLKLSLNQNKDVFTIHLGKGSWEDKDSKFLIFWLREWKICLFIFLIFIILVIILLLKK
jgi:mannosyltransferase OCH1-like enzyme